MAKNRLSLLAKLGVELLSRLPMVPGVAYRITRANPDYAARLASAQLVDNTAQSDQAGSLVSSYLCAAGYIKRVPDPTGRQTNPNRSGYYEITPDGIAFKQSQGQLRLAMEQEMARRFRKYGNESAEASKVKNKAKAEAEGKAKAAANVEATQSVNPKALAAAPTIHPESIEMKTAQGFISIKMKDSPENRKKAAELLIK